MGVMSCSRLGCDMIMCDTYIQGVGYICHECKAEFARYLENLGIEKATKPQMVQHLKSFMLTTSDGHNATGPEMSADEFFNQNT